MARSLFGRMRATRRRPTSGQAERAVAGSQVAEQAHRLTAALAEREAGREAFRRRWGGMACHLPNDPYDGR